ncbi:PIF1-like helicase [Medicago truncatula]|uniref:PIF1-like helicase n=1 Tax=Medicago truncatula TaxID=3880 RepID=G7IM36_MEDTR|nr:PIF1-like helicase [Medicago truncatula]
MTQNSNGDAIDDVHTPEFLNTINASGLSHHKIILKIGVSIMLLRNIDLKLGLCNGTRLIITIMGKFNLEGKVISGKVEQLRNEKMELWLSGNGRSFCF